MTGYGYNRFHISISKVSDLNAAVDLFSRPVDNILIQVSIRRQMTLMLGAAGFEMWYILLHNGARLDETEDIDKLFYRI